MKIYLAVGKGMVASLQSKAALLMSYYWLRHCPDMIIKIAAMPTKCMLDSGAFSAWQQNTAIDREAYCGYIKRFGSNYSVCANLDVIGNAQASFSNWQFFTDRGLNVMPVFHVDSPLDILKTYCENSDYIALGGMAGKSCSSKKASEFLEEAFGVISKYWPKKIHGFGCAKSEFLIKFPFYSVDTTAWLIGAQWGHICEFKGGKLQWSPKLRYTIPSGKKLPLKWVKLINASKDRNIYWDTNVKALMQMQGHVTERWRRKGIIWND